MGHGGDTPALLGGVNADDDHTPEAAADNRRSASGDRMSPGERRLLATMPLHAVTALHGETGLRERLALETEAFTHDDRDRITRALDLAARLHASDRRQCEPYINH